MAGELVLSSVNGEPVGVPIFSPEAARVAARLDAFAERGDSGAVSRLLHEIDGAISRAERAAADDAVHRAKTYRRKTSWNRDVTERIHGPTTRLLDALDTVRGVKGQRARLFQRGEVATEAQRRHRDCEQHEALHAAALALRSTLDSGAAREIARWTLALKHDVAPREPNRSALRRAHASVTALFDGAAERAARRAAAAVRVAQQLPSALASRVADEAFEATAALALGRERSRDGLANLASEDPRWREDELVEEARQTTERLVSPEYVRKLWNVREPGKAAGIVAQAAGCESPKTTTRRARGAERRRPRRAT